MFTLICVWINGCVNNRKAGDLRRYCAHYGVTVMYWVGVGAKPLPESILTQFAYTTKRHYATLFWNVLHHSDVIISAMASQITSVSIVCSTVCSGADVRKYQCSASRAVVRGIHRWAVVPSQRASKCGNASIWWRHLIMNIHWKPLSNFIRTWRAFSIIHSCCVQINELTSKFYWQITVWPYFSPMFHHWKTNGYSFS